MSRYLLDTEVLIDYFTGVPSAAELIGGMLACGDDLFACGIVVAELYSGVHPSDRPKARVLVDGLQFAATGPQAAAQAGEWRYDFARRGRTLTAADCLIAATAQSIGATLVTGNVKDYPMAELKVRPSRRT